MFLYQEHITGIFLENNLKYLNAHNNELGGAISVNYRLFLYIRFSI